ncbi:MAG: hypothetical protein WCB15_31285, partial [Desulfobacterales bacterium]
SKTAVRIVHHYILSEQYKKFQITKHIYPMVRQAVRQAHGPEQGRRTHHHPEPSRMQITMTEL